MNFKSQGSFLQFFVQLRILFKYLFQSTLPCNVTKNRLETKCVLVHCSALALPYMSYFFCQRSLAKKQSLAYVGNWKHSASGLGLSAEITASMCDCVSDHRFHYERQRWVEVYQVKEVKVPIGVGDGHSWPDLTLALENDLHVTFLSSNVHTSKVCVDLLKFRTISFSPQCRLYGQRRSFPCGLLCQACPFMYLISFQSHGNPVRQALLSSVYR